METSKLKKFAQFARRTLIDQESAKIELVLDQGSAARRENPEAIEKLEQSLQDHGKDMVIEQVAYTWFNRFCALRFMDMQNHTGIGVVSPAEGQLQPEILAEAKMGHIDQDKVSTRVREKIFALLDGSTPSHDPQSEAYRLLLVATCNYWHRFMPFMFERIADYTELLMPDDLLSENSILFHIREAMTQENCSDVEIIGWLYQFYISEKKDQVFEGLKKNKKITPENIPAATQLFTPHWIVRYLVENSLGRLWMLNNPDSKLIEQMDYYIAPAEETNREKRKKHEKDNGPLRDFSTCCGSEDFLKISSPEEIKICDPACGSGHMLVYAFVLLYAIYLEEGYEPSKIPAKILTHNLYGIEIDKRAADLAAFALFMKACQYDKRFFRRMASKGQTVRPNICVLKNIRFEDGELENYVKHLGLEEVFSKDLKTTLRQFEEADNFGSLIRPDVTDVDDILKMLESKNVSGQLFTSMTHQKVLRALKYADYLSPKYHIVVANPPYMGSRNMSLRTIDWIKLRYSNAKSDLFSAFIIRCCELTIIGGRIGIMSPNVWMYISSHESLRQHLLSTSTITNLVELPLSGFKGATVQICAFNLINLSIPSYQGSFIRLVEVRGGDKEMASHARRIISGKHPENHFFSSSKNFEDIPGNPISYWTTRAVRNAFIHGTPLGKLAMPRQGMATTNNGLFVRRWSEISINKSNLTATSEADAILSGSKWFPYNKGGEYRKWYGNGENFVNYEHGGKTICDYIDNTPGAKVGSNGRVINRDKYFKPSVTWSFISSSYFGVRYSPKGFIFDVAGSSVFPEGNEIIHITGFLCSKVTSQFLSILNPTLNFQVGNIASLPIIDGVLDFDSKAVCLVIELAKQDWDAYETSWDFISLPLLNPDYRQSTLQSTYQTLRTHWQEMTLEMQRLEEENNRIFIDAYGLQDELTPDVPLKEITLTCNPYYRYGKEDNQETRELDDNLDVNFRGSKIFPVDEEIEARLLNDTIREFISYSVGCMFGRYSLDNPGLILANQGETFEDYLKQVPDPTFAPDKENVIPILDGDWFTDDLAERFKEFLKITFGRDNFEDNLRFIEKALSKDLRKYLLKDFYSDHVRRYKKRPIYWMFSSPNGSFNALIYMHRYQPDTVSVVLNRYLREFLVKLNSRKQHLEGIGISTSTTSSEKTKALNEIEKLKKIISELEDYERKILYPLAVKKVEIDLDDGVKVNYPKFGKALKKVPGLSG